ncbi:MAG: aminoglycoside 6-adenylyltransferase [Thermomicrobiales bacterium]
MHEVQRTDDVIRRLVQWVEEQAAIRAVLLTSTRSIPSAALDAYSDYDVILVVRDIHPFVLDRRWVEVFGEVLVAYWDPIHPDPDYGIEYGGNVIQYADGLKIDFTIWPVSLLERIASASSLPAELDAGYQVLPDKDRLTANLQAPTNTSYIPARPDELTFQTTINDFVVGAPYVAKCLLGDELLPAKWCLDFDMRDVYLRPMLEWRLECDHDWSIPVGALGKGLKRRLSPAIWAELEDTYAGAGIEDNWESLFRMMAFFGRVARDVAAHLGYAYLDELDERVTAHVRRMRDEESALPVRSEA